MAKLLCFLSFLLYSQLFITSSASSPPALCPQDQSNALLQFKTNFSLDRQASIYCSDAGTKTYPKTKSWKKGTDCCKWDGVKCENETGNVIGLDLSCSWLRGSIYSNSSLFHLKHLQKLNLAHNDFQRSKVFPEFGSLVSLTHLNFTFSNLDGQVPLQLSRLSRLVSLDLSISGGVTLESSVLKAIIQNLTQLRDFALDHVYLASIEPSTFANLPTSLTSLSLNQCDLKGEFPGNIISYPNLKKLILSENGDLTGDFSTYTWSNSLQHLDIQFTNTAGKLPNSIGNLKSLQYLDVSGCKFSGSIPASIGNLKDMWYLGLFRNDFSGPIPHSLANLEQLKFLALSENRLAGKIPNVFGKLTKLIGLGLGVNRLTGTIPSSICQISKLQILVLSNNTLSGTIPPCLGKLTSLESFDVSNNHLVGPIPSGRLRKFHNESYEGNPGLCGFPLSKKCTRE